MSDLHLKLLVHLLEHCNHRFLLLILEHGLFGLFFELFALGVFFLKCFYLVRVCLQQFLLVLDSPLEIIIRRNQFRCLACLLLSLFLLSLEFLDLRLKVHFRPLKRLCQITYLVLQALYQLYLAPFHFFNLVLRLLKLCVQFMVSLNLIIQLFSQPLR